MVSIRQKIKSRWHFFVDSAWRPTSTESKKPISDWYHLPLQAAAAAWIIYWYWNPPAANKAVLLLAGMAALMVLVDMRPLHKTIYFVLIIALVFTENRAIDKERADFSRDETNRRQEENKQFSGIGGAITTNVEKLLDHSDEQFSQTVRTQNQQFRIMLRGFTGVTSKENQLLAQPPSLMTCKDLSEGAKELAVRLRGLRRRWELADEELEKTYWNEMTFGGITDARRAELQKEGVSRRNELLLKREEATKTTIAAANEFRAEMVKRLAPDLYVGGGAGWEAWFQQPVSVMDMSLGGAKYLDDLARLMLMSCGEP